MHRSPKVVKYGQNILEIYLWSSTAREKINELIEGEIAKMEATGPFNSFYR